MSFALRVLAFVYFWQFAAMGALLPFLPPYLENRGFSHSDIGWLLACMTALRVVAPTIWGYIADRTGARVRVVQIGLLGAGSAVLTLEQAQTFSTFATLLMVYGALSAAILPQIETITVDALGDEPKRYGEVRLWGSVGFVLSVVASGYLVERFGQHWLIAIVVGCQALTLATLAFFPAQARRHSVDGGLERAGLSQILRRKHVVVFFGVALLMSASHAPYYGFFAIQMNGLGHGQTVIGALWAIAVITEIGLFSQSQRILSMFTIRVGLILVFAVSAARWVGTGLWAGELWVSWIFQAAHAISFGLFHALSIEFIRSAFPPHAHGRGQALYTSISFGVGGAIGAASAGVLWENHGALAAYLAAAIACALAGALVAATFPSRAPLSTEPKER